MAIYGVFMTLWFLYKPQKIIIKFVNVHTHMHAHTLTHTYTHTYIRTHIYTVTHTHTQTYAHTLTDTLICTSTLYTNMQNTFILHVCIYTGLHSVEVNS